MTLQRAERGYKYDVYKLLTAPASTTVPLDGTKAPLKIERRKEITLEYLSDAGIDFGTLQAGVSFSIQQTREERITYGPIYVAPGESLVIEAWGVFKRYSFDEYRGNKKIGSGYFLDLERKDFTQCSKEDPYICTPEGAREKINNLEETLKFYQEHAADYFEEVIKSFPLLGNLYEQLK